MAAIMITGYAFDAAFKKFRQVLNAREARIGVPFVVWGQTVDRLTDRVSEKIRVVVHHGRTVDKHNVEVISIMFRETAVDDACRLSRRAVEEAVLVVTATEEQIAVLRRKHEDQINRFGYVMLRGHVPLLGDFNAAALVCKSEYNANALVDELFPVALEPERHDDIGFAETPGPVVGSTGLSYG